MTEHVHGCLSCRPDMVPDFSKDDPCYHDGGKCNHTVYALVNGEDPGYTKGIFEGPEGWVLSASRGYDSETIHECPTCTTRDEEGFLKHHEICLTPIFGNVQALHHCPSDLQARIDRLKVELKPLVSEEAYERAVYGREVVP